MDTPNNWNTYGLRWDMYDWMQYCYSPGLTPITNNVYISDWDSSLDTSLLEKHNIKTILCVNERAKPAYMLDKYISNDIVHYQLQAEDMPTEDLARFFRWSYDFINNSRDRGNVLVHCTAGISRSATIVTHYLLWKAKQEIPTTTLSEVLEFMKKRRPCINPNPSFMKQLHAAEKKMDTSLSKK